MVDEQDDKIYSYNIPDATQARLAELTLSGIELPGFIPARFEYAVEAASGSTSTIVSAAATQEDATLAILPADADGDAQNGRQVSLQGETKILVTVTSADGSRQRVYRVLVSATSCLNGLTAERISQVAFAGGSVEELEACARSVGVIAFLHLAGRSGPATSSTRPRSSTDPSATASSAACRRARSCSLFKSQSGPVHRPSPNATEISQ